MSIVLNILFITIGVTLAAAWICACVFLAYALFVNTRK